MRLIVTFRWIHTEYFCLLTLKGDSGGPLVITRNNGYKAESFVIGVTSFGLGCATDAPGIYTNVAKYLDWIEPILWPDFIRKNEG